MILKMKVSNSGDDMKLIVGLGNPGKDYENTRHNVGFSIIDNYVNKNNLGDFKQKYNGLYLKTRLNGFDVIFLKPQSYMNLSGEVVRKFVDFYKIPISDILVVSDDMDLSLGNFKLKPSGSSGGHNGLKNIELHLDSNKYKRLKIGISKSEKQDVVDYVLGKFTVSEKQLLNSVKDKTVDIISDFFVDEFDVLMNKYNRKNR